MTPLTTAQIQALLDRYEAAKTSLDEERQLRQALAQPQLDESLQPYRQWFAGLDLIASAKTLGRPGPWQSANAAPLAPAQLTVVHRTGPRQLWRRLAIAALALVVLGAALLFWRKPQTALQPNLADDSTPKAIDWSKYEVTDPAEAARITRAALTQVSHHLHRGTELTAAELGHLESLHHVITSNRKS